MPKRRLVRILVGVVVASAALGVWGLVRARDEARRIGCEENLKQIGLGLHNYMSACESFPYAGFPDRDLLHDRRLSWTVATLPYMLCMDCWGLGEFIKQEPARGWDSGPQAGLAGIPLEWMLCPASPDAAGSRGVYSGMHYLDRSRLTVPVPTTYIGIGGLGGDSPLLKDPQDPRAGIFGYDRQTRPEDVVDGLSATMMVAETSRTIAPWTASGEATVRGLDPARPPYVGPRGQFGGNHPESALVLFADGSVRRIKPSIAPKVFEALSTIAGGEQIPAGAIGGLR